MILLDLGGDFKHSVMECPQRLFVGCLQKGLRGGRTLELDSDIQVSPSPVLVSVCVSQRHCDRRGDKGCQIACAAL